ncbi:MAG: hypothetical protein RLZ98_2756 [Pseudomonadota bacterium]
MHLRFGDMTKATVLSGILAGMGWLVWSAATHPLPVAGIETKIGKVSLSSPPLQEAPGLPHIDWTEDRAMLERPIFEKTRRPQLSKPVLAPRKTIARAEEIAPPKGLRLLGTMRDQSGDALALVASQKWPNGEWYRLGAEIEGWRLGTIEPGGVMLEARSRVIPLRLYPNTSPSR